MNESIITKIETAELTVLVAKATSIAEILRKLNFKVFNAYHYRKLKKRLQKSKIDFSHIPQGLNSNIGRNFDNTTLTKDEALAKWFVKKTENLYCSGTNKILKKFILKFHLIPYECSFCFNKGEWNDKKLMLQLDHKDGNSSDNQLSNLRFLCPNCHSQTETFCRSDKGAMV